MSEQTRTLAEALAPRRLLGFATVQATDAAPAPAATALAGNSKIGAVKVGTGKTGATPDIRRPA